MLNNGVFWKENFKNSQNGRNHWENASSTGKGRAEFVTFCCTRVGFVV